MEHLDLWPLLPSTMVPSFCQHPNYAARVPSPESHEEQAMAPGWRTRSRASLVALALVAGILSFACSGTLTTAGAPNSVDPTGLLTADRYTTWNPGLMSVGGPPNPTTICPTATTPPTPTRPQHPPPSTPPPTHPLP